MDQAYKSSRQRAEERERERRKRHEEMKRLRDLEEAPRRLAAKLPANYFDRRVHGAARREYLTL